MSLPSNFTQVVTAPIRHRVLRGSGNNAANRAFLAGLERAFPPQEYQALAAWISSFFGYQQNWLLDSSRFSLLVKCRQIGASHTYAAAAVLWALLGEETSIVSIGQRESDEVLQKVGKHAEALCRLGSSWARLVSRSANRVRLATGGHIASLPATSGGRGRSGNMLLDEAAYYEHPEKVWDGASATALHGYRIRLMSTPNGVGNMFHSMHQACAANHYRLHTVSLSDAIADGLKVNEAECWSLAKGDPRLFDQLFNCKFLDGHAQYIPTEAVEACTVPFVGMGPGEFYAGLDIGRTVDLTVLVVVRCGPDRTRWVQEVLTCKRTSSDDLEAMVAAAFVKYNLRRVCVDATGMGAFPAERMQKIHGKQRVEPVNFTQGSKEDLATGMYSAFTESTVRLPRSDAKLRDDVCAIRRIVTSAGNIRYDAPRTDEGHADRAWALALALHSCRTPPNVKHIAPGR